MHLIWFNPKVGKYEYGNVALYQQVKMKEKSVEDYTVLMEFPKDDKALATKVIEELNQSDKDLAMA